MTKIPNITTQLSIIDAIEKNIIYPFSYITALYDTDGLLDEYKDVDMSQYINNNTKYDEFGLPIIDFDKKEEFNELPKITQFGISE